jgi:mannitol-1-/sugar-/sorbitol-6-/2-deoxyglucose-6-phosphatase
MTGVIFDLDGVLVNSEPYWQRGFAEIATQFCLERGLPDPGLTPKQMSRFQGGRVNDTVAAILSGLGHGNHVDPTTVVALTDRVIDHVSRQFAKNANAIESSVRVARQLADRGIPLAVASSSAQQFIDTALEAIGLSDAFAVTQSALELKHGKPHPEVYLLTLDKMGLKARDVVAIEDSTTGLGAALRADLATIWLLQDTAESEADSLERLRATLGNVAGAADLVRRVTRDLTIEDVEDVMKAL